MTELIFLKDSYRRTFKATVKESDENYVVLDRTAFYPEGGGQPTDTGFLEYNGNKIKISKVRKEKGVVKHYLAEPEVVIEEGTQVKGIIDWGKRYTFMRMHTSQHLISRIILEDFKARTVGNQIHERQSRMDFHPVKFSEQDLRTIEKKANALIAQKIAVHIYTKSRAELESQANIKDRSNLELIPAHIDPLRVVEIEGVDICPCGGTHVRNLEEIKGIRIVKRENKGKDRDRIIFELAT